MGETFELVAEPVEDGTTVRVYVCDECGGVVAENAMTRHSIWHERLDRVIGDDSV